MATDGDAAAAPNLRATAPVIAGFPIDEKWTLHLAAYPALGLTYERGAAALNESAGVGQFLGVSVEAELEIWVRLDGQVMWSLGWGHHVLAGLFTSFAYR